MEINNEPIKEINNEPIKERKRKYHSEEEIRQARLNAMKRYREKNGEEHREKVRNASLKCYYKNKEKGINKAMDCYRKKHPNPQPRGRPKKPKEPKEPKIKLNDEKEKYKKIKKSELVDKIIALSNILNKQ